MKLVADDSVPDVGTAQDAQAIVVLAGGMRRNAEEYGADTLNALSLERARYAAFLFRRTGLPILVTGGVLQGGEPEAELIRRTLEDEFGVRVRWVETLSRDTHENAVFSVRILQQAGIRRAVLVTHAFHLRRARREFSAAGLDVVPAPIQIPNGPSASLAGLIPTMNALHGSYFAVHELVGNAVLSLPRR